MAQTSARRSVVALGFAITTVGFAVLIATSRRGRTPPSCCPLLAVAVGMSMSNGPCSSVATSAVPVEQVGAASGISNMARYVGAAVMTAVVAAIYGSVSADRVDAGESSADALASVFARASVAMAIISAAGIGFGPADPPAPPPEPRPDRSGRRSSRGRPHPAHANTGRTQTCHDAISPRRLPRSSLPTMS